MFVAMSLSFVNEASCSPDNFFGLLRSSERPAPGRRPAPTAIVTFSRIAPLLARWFAFSNKVSGPDSPIIGNQRINYIYPAAATDDDVVGGGKLKLRPRLGGKGHASCEASRRAYLNGKFYYQH